MDKFFRVGTWRISSDGRQFETGYPITNMVTIELDDVAELLANNPEALKSVLEKVASEAAKKVGNNHPLVIALETLVGTQFPPLIPAEGPVSQAKPPQPWDNEGH